MFVIKVVIGVGSNGMSVFEGYFEGCYVVVKRFLVYYYDKVVKEIKFFIISDEYLNVVRYFVMEEIMDFVYVVLERCVLSLYDFIVFGSDNNFLKVGCKDDDFYDVKYLKLFNGKDLKLWDDNGCCLF